MSARRTGAALLMLALAGCDRGGGDAPPGKQGAQAYLLFRPATPQQGWDAVAAMRTQLRAADARRIRTSGVIDSRRPEMYVDVDATCDRDAAFVRDAQRIAQGAGVATLTCSNTLPGAL